MTIDYSVYLPRPHDKQIQFIKSKSPRKIIKAGRRGGKTVGMGLVAVKAFLDGKRVLYAVPTTDQLEQFWFVVSEALAEPIEAGVYKKSLVKHQISLPGTKQAIRAKTAWNADTLRGDFADELIFDEYQLMNEDAWQLVGAPMLLDNNGNATFIFTPPSLASRSVSKARDPFHANKLFNAAIADDTGRWEVFHFTSLDNPYISKQALNDIQKDMTAVAYRQEVLAEDIDEYPGALWSRDNIDANRVIKSPDNLDKVVVGVDPSTTSLGDETGIVTVGRKREHYYTISDDSVQGSPQEWAEAAVMAYYKYEANYIAAEKNQGGEMVTAVIKQVDPNVHVKLVWASRGKATRAEPVAAIAEQNRDHHVGVFELLEDELCRWTPGDASPNRLDAKVWAMTELMLTTVKVGKPKIGNYMR